MALASLATVANGAAEGKIDDVAFLRGCWSGTVDGATVAERWDAPSAGTMLGTSKTITGDRTVQFEFLKITATKDGVTYTPYINGQEAATFTLSATKSTDLLRFENPANDFPKVIEYRAGSDRLDIRLLGANSQEMAYSLQKQPCL